MIKFILFLLFTSYVNAISECEKCQLYGECNLSYLNYPGKFCDVWKPAYNLTIPCCCPIAAECVNSLHKCNCKYINTPEENYHDTIVIIIVFSIIIIILLLIVSKVHSEIHRNHYVHTSYYSIPDTYHTIGVYGGDS